MKLFGDVGWDPSGEWSQARLENLRYFHAFMPNQREAMAFTGKEIRGPRCTRWRTVCPWPW